MSSNLVFTFNGLTSDPFDDWFDETHGTGEFDVESDVDETEEDRFDDPESY